MIKDSSVQVRAATIADCRSVWDWRCDPRVALLSSGPNEIGHAQYRRWFVCCLTDQQIHLLIGHIKSVRIGCVLFRALGPGIWRLRAFIKPAYCGRDLTAPMINASIVYLTDLEPVESIFVNTPRINSASSAAFTDCGFEVCINDSGDEFLMHLTRSPQADAASMLS